MDYIMSFFFFLLCIMYLPEIEIWSGAPQTCLTVERFVSFDTSLRTSIPKNTFWEQLIYLNTDHLALSVLKITTIKNKTSKQNRNRLIVTENSWVIARADGNGGQVK